jgi:hypothetical protein
MILWMTRQIMNRAHQDNHHDLFLIPKMNICLNIKPNLFYPAWVVFIPVAYSMAVLSPDKQRLSIGRNAL